MTTAGTPLGDAADVAEDAAALRATRRLALAGLVGPPLFAATTVLVTALEWDFLHELGWSAAPFEQPDTPWPSSAALGDYGVLQVLAFLLLGVSVTALAVALFRLLRARRRLGPGLLVLLGAALAAAAIRTDRGTATGAGPETWSGVAHAAALTVAVAAAIASMLALGAAFRGDARWGRLSAVSFAAALAALALLAATLAGAGGVFFALFLAVVLTWLGLVSLHALGLSAAES